MNSQVQIDDEIRKAFRDRFYIPQSRWLFCETCQASALDKTGCILLDHKLVWLPCGR